MIKINIDNYIPPELQQKMANAAVDFLTKKAENYIGEQMSAVIKRLRSDYEFHQKFKVGLETGLQRFYNEYIYEDEDLVLALFKEKFLLEEGNIHKVILEVIANPGKYRNRENQIIEQSFEEVLPERHNRDRVNRAVSFFLQCIIREVCQLPELRSAYEIEYLRSTSEGIIESVGIQKAQLQTLQKISEDVKSALIDFTDKLAEKKLQAKNYTPVFHNLPRYDESRFVGREERIKELRNRLSPNDRSWVISVDGIGGVGKTTLALEVANHYVKNYHKISEHERFDAVIWTSAKRTILTGEGILNHIQSFRTLEDIYSTIAITLEREDIIRHPIEQQDDLVQKVLRKCRTLLIIDNFETIDDERILSFIRDIASPTKVIVTTRRKIEPALSIRLKNLSQKESIRLIKNELKVKEIQISDKEILSLAAVTMGLPLAIIWSLSLLGSGFPFESVISRLGEPTNDLSKFCFDETINLIKNHASYKLLLSLSLFSMEVDRFAIGRISGLNESERDNGLLELEKLSLVNRTGNRFGLLPLTRVYAQYELQHNQDYAKQAVVEGGRFLSSQTNELPEWHWIQDQVGVLVNGENFLGLLDWAILFKDIQTIEKVAKPCVLYLDYIGRRGEASELAFGILELIEYNKSSLPICAWLHLKNGWIIAQQKENQNKATQEILSANVAFSKLGSANGVLLAECFSAQVSRHFNNNRDVRPELEDLRKQARKMAFSEGIILTEYELAKVYRESHDIELSYTHFSNAFQELSRQDAIIGSWFSLTKEAIKGNFAEAAYALGKLEESEQAVLEILKSLERWNQFNLATNFLSRMLFLDAKIKLRKEQLSDAKSNALKSLKLARSTNNQKFVNEIQSFMAKANMVQQ